VGCHVDLVLVLGLAFSEGGLLVELALVRLLDFLLLVEEELDVVYLVAVLDSAYQHQILILIKIPIHLITISMITECQFEVERI